MFIHDQRVLAAMKVNYASLFKARLASCDPNLSLKPRNMQSVLYSCILRPNSMPVGLVLGPELTARRARG